jgi:hypothetical protein
MKRRTASGGLHVVAVPFKPFPFLELVIFFGSNIVFGATPIFLGHSSEVNVKKNAPLVVHVVDNTLESLFIFFNVENEDMIGRLDEHIERYCYNVSIGCGAMLLMCFHSSRKHRDLQQVAFTGLVERDLQEIPYEFLRELWVELRISNKNIEIFRLRKWDGFITLKEHSVLN